MAPASIGNSFLESSLFPGSGGVRNAGAEGLRVLGYKVVVDSVLQRTQDDDGPRVVYLNLKKKNGRQKRKRKYALGLIKCNRKSRKLCFVVGIL
jgi:hypothetical protein